MTEPRKLTASERGRLGGLTAAQRMTPEARIRRAEKANAAWMEKHGRAELLRMSYQRTGRLARKGRR
ncbi:MAG: hypothetical protein FIB00_11930 [Chloroflexi bacterium]|nr:hypothetical protein [Dehalococcoidia bacterium]NJD65932.1 hypothetical protein [Chloroflexota bacterium]PWB44976.1 MAG: hypothetical protein C3F10_07135 [Dehalococcoidia bacterium]